MLDVMREHEDSRDTYEWLTAYIQPLESDTGDLYHTEFMTMPGVMSSVSYVVYEPIMLASSIPYSPGARRISPRRCVVTDSMQMWTRRF